MNRIILMSGRKHLYLFNSPFVERRLHVSAGWSTGTPFTLHSSLPALPCALALHIFIDWKTVQ